MSSLHLVEPDSAMRVRESMLSLNIVVPLMNRVMNKKPMELVNASIDATPGDNRVGLPRDLWRIFRSTSACRAVSRRGYFLLGGMPRYTI